MSDQLTNQYGCAYELGDVKGLGTVCRIYRRIIASSLCQSTVFSFADRLFPRLCLRLTEKSKYSTIQIRNIIPRKIIKKSWFPIVLLLTVETHFLTVLRVIKQRQFSLHLIIFLFILWVFCSSLLPDIFEAGLKLFYVIQFDQSRQLKSFNACSPLHCNFERQSSGLHPSLPFLLPSVLPSPHFLLLKLSFFENARSLWLRTKILTGYLSKSIQFGGDQSSNKDVDFNLFAFSVHSTMKILLKSVTKRPIGSVG